jgi:hypothetical protein
MMLVGLMELAELWKKEMKVESVYMSFILLQKSAGRVGLY